MFSYFLANNPLVPNQSGFKSGDSCINQLLLLITFERLKFNEMFRFLLAKSPST